MTLSMIIGGYVGWLIGCGICILAMNIFVALDASPEDRRHDLLSLNRFIVPFAFGICTTFALLLLALSSFAS